MPAKMLHSPEMPIVAVVDDDEAVREALSDLLLVLELACQTFDRAESFMAEYVPDRFDCLITDVSMPGRSGLELQERLRELGSTMPVIVITADVSPATHARALSGGALACLTKPVNDDVLFRYLQSALNHAGGSRGDDRRDTPSDD
ncbi:response regulator [Bradyrhizobium arachidis]|uniref:response regulator transcription factor n=1 Tax=Bradyrhizobium TaxID=374 RepID=UPI001AEEED66|nr:MULTISPECIES: response regulator [Bradyrhizobium]MDN4984096.1 response regulator [Bradyrhizobium sp. WYCCWR 13022]UVO38907.1 response regulator [Bradyrhizobium arachidis]